MSPKKRADEVSRMVTNAPGGPDEQSFGSTTWALRRVKVTGTPPGHATVRRSRSSWRALPQLDRRRYVTLRIKWRGGAESWWLVDARGRSVPVPGWICLEDLMISLLAEPG